MSRESNLALYFPAVAYYDGQGFMLPRSRNIDSALDLNNSKVCVQEGTTTVLNVADHFRVNNMKYTEVKLAKLEDVLKAYEGGKCDTFTADVSQLYALRLNPMSRATTSSCPTSSPRSRSHPWCGSATTTG